MDMIFTDQRRVDQGILSAYSLDMSFGESENNFEMTVGVRSATLEFGAYLYMEGTEYGGIVDTKKSYTTDDNITYKGRTWHGVLNSKIIQPDPGADYYIVSGEANDLLGVLISRLGLSDLFVPSEESSGVVIEEYQFDRYCKGYDGIRAMLATHGAKLKFCWKDRKVCLSAEPVVDYTDYPIDGDVATLMVEQNNEKVNHLICLGRGDLADREIIHLYVDQFGSIGDIQFYTGIEEYTDVYDYSNAESSEELRKGGINRMVELRSTDKAEISLIESDTMMYDVGDIVPAKDVKSGISACAPITQKIVKINNGAVRTEYKTGSAIKNG